MGYYAFLRSFLSRDIQKSLKYLTEIWLVSMWALRGKQAEMKNEVLKYMHLSCAPPFLVAELDIAHLIQKYQASPKPAEVSDACCRLITLQCHC